ncbi:MAG: DUF5716 family protein [Defluviitaleaceae bacterium]|nr:DUF5716 family protein [Defluviitaleaceae bacterium]
MTHSWKIYRKRFEENLLDARSRESLFILGVDLGNHSSSLAYFDHGRGGAEIIDVSGGYGKPSMPTALQYAKESRDFVFGEYALLNRGVTDDAIITGLIERTLRKEYLDIGDKPIGAEQATTYYLRELLQNCRNINPNAEFAGIVLSLPGYASEENKEALLQVFKLAGYDKPLISMDSDRECVFSNYFLKIKPKKENTVLLDFGARELRGGIYEIIPADEDEGVCMIKCLSSFFDKNIGTDAIDAAMDKLITEHYCSEAAISKDKINPQIYEQIKSFSYQHKDVLFQFQPGGRPVKLYYNFLYPPVVLSVTDKVMNETLRPYKERFTVFLKRLFNLAGDNAVSIDTILCSGGGFEMLWVRDTIRELYPRANVIIDKNPKAAAASGASIRAAAALGVIDIPKFMIEDSHRLTIDIGVLVQNKHQNIKREKFLPIVEMGSFWWQERGNFHFIYLGGTGAADCDIPLYSRNDEGEIRQLATIPLRDLPTRPPGTTKLNLSVNFKNPNECTVKLSDCGFGELFPMADYNQEIHLMI